MNLTKRDQNLGTIVTLLAIALLLLYLMFSVFGFNDSAFLSTGILSIGAVIFSVFITHKYRKQNQPAVIDYLNIGTQRHILGLFMIFYGVPKLLGGFFDYQLFALDTKLGDVSEFELAWYFFGKNRWQELFSGIMEFIPGILLLNRRTYYFGAILLLPVTAQVFILNFFFQIGGVTFPAAVVLLMCNLYILYSEKEKIIKFIKSLDFSRSVNLTGWTRVFIKVCKWTFIILALLLAGMQTKSALFKSDKQRNYENLVGMYTLERMKKNMVEYSPTISDSVYYKDLYIEKQSRWNILRRFNNETDAFIVEFDGETDSISLYINKGGIGDNLDIKDDGTMLKGTYKLDSNTLTIHGVQLNDTLQLTYKRQGLKPKQWFW